MHARVQVEWTISLLQKRERERERARAKERESARDRKVLVCACTRRMKLLFIRMAVEAL